MYNLRTSGKKMGIKISKKCRKKKVLIFGKITFFLKAIYTIELIENHDSTHESKYFRNYMGPNFMWCQKIVLYMTMPKWSDRLPIF